MKTERIILKILCILSIFSIFFCKGVLAQYNYNRIIFADNYPISLYNLYNNYPYSQINHSLNWQNNLLWARNKTVFQPYSALFSFNNTSNNLNLIQNASNNLNLIQRSHFSNIFSNPIMSLNMSAIMNPIINPLQHNGVSMGNISVPAFSYLFSDPLQSNGVLSGNTHVAEEIMPVFSMFSEEDTLTFKNQSTQWEASVESEIMAKDALTEEVLALANELTQHVLSLADHMGSQLDQFQSLAIEAKPHFAETMEEFMENAMGWSSEGQSFVESVLPMAATFAEKGMELGAQFAEKGMELGYEFASKGEEVGPMANRILFMATQIGVMADRIGEMADRILFMADDIVEFGDKILYVSQLIVYTEELMVNVTVLINETIRTISDMILTMLAITTDNETYLQLRAEWLENDNQALPLIYENMNRMLDHMLIYSLKLLENEAQTEENQIKVRELQIELREATMSANDCFCPGFCVDPNQCI